jgi:hypothetical protein
MEEEWGREAEGANRKIWATKRVLTYYIHTKVLADSAESK